MSLLEVEDLSVTIGGLRVLNRVSFAIESGERVGLIGESGSGKSMTALAVIGLLPEGAATRGRIALDGRDMLKMSERQLCALRGGRVAMIFQEPMTALNPTMRVEKQVGEVVRLHERTTRRDAAARTLELLARVEFPDPERIARAYPSQLSGGQRQRVMVAMAVACRPTLVLADEPTTALDVTVQQQILQLVTRLVTEDGATLLLISHDLAVVSAMCDRIIVMYAGSLVERGSSATLLSAPCHPYTAGLLATSAALSVDPEDPRELLLPAIPGSVPAPGALPAGCAFRPRCPRADTLCETEPTLLADEHAAACWHPLEDASVLPRAHREGS